MRDPSIRLATDSHRNAPLVSLSFEKDWRLIGEQLLGWGGFKIRGICIHAAEDLFKNTYLSGI